MNCLIVNTSMIPCHFNLYLLTTKPLNRMGGLMFRFGLSIVSVPLACSPASAGGWLIRGAVRMSSTPASVGELGVGVLC